MSKTVNPADRANKSGKFSPEKMQDESHGSVTSAGRQQRNMDDVSRGAESGTSRKNPR